MKAFLLAIAVCLSLSGVAFAQSAEGPGILARVTGDAAEFTFIDQGGSKVERIERTLRRIRLPAGFRIALYAVVPDARHIAVGPQGVATFVGTRHTKVWAVTDRDRDGVADEVRDFAPGLDFAIPNGPCFDGNGTLYIAEQNRVLLFPDAEANYESPDIAAFELVPQGRLIPPEEQSRGHSARVCDIGPDSRIYISLGQPFNVTPPGKLEKYRDWGIGGIIRLNLDGTGREVFTYGIRNSVGQDFDPKTGDLWFTDNQVDGMGDDIPPGELNHQTEPGQDFGFPWYGGGAVRTREYVGQPVPVDAVMPVVEAVAHAADLGMVFYTGDAFPAKYRNAIFSAQHGSWNRSTPVGARVMVTFIGADGAATMEPFAEGWIDATGDYLGRPVDVANLPDGSILVSDDKAGALYRISYGE